MRDAAAAALLALAACGEARPPQALTEGQRARAAVDSATQVYGACVLGEAERMPVAGAQPGTLAQRAVAACPAQRDALAARIRELHRIGNPSRTPAYSDAVADASIKGLESGLRAQAVVVIIGRQG